MNIRKPIAGCLAAAVMLVPAVANAQNASVACMYMLLRVYHAELDHCKVSLPKERESRYLRMRANMETYIRANAKVDPEKIIAGIDATEKKAIAGLTSCQSDDFKLARQAIDQLTDFSNEHVVNETLKIPRDPQSGSCG
jgi:hypothetical protein